MEKQTLNIDDDDDVDVDDDDDDDDNSTWAQKCRPGNLSTKVPFLKLLLFW